MVAGLVVAYGSAFGQVMVSPPEIATPSPVVTQQEQRPQDALTMNALLGFINSEPVFVHDMLRAIDEDLRNIARDANGNPAVFRSRAKDPIEAQLRRYVQGILMISNARTALTDEDRARVDMLFNKYRADLLAKHGGSESLADQALRAEGTSVDKVFKDVRRELTVEMYLRKTLYNKIHVTRDMMLNGYQRSPERWQQRAEIELFTITLPVSRQLPRESGTNGTLGKPIARPTAEQIEAAKVATMKQALQLVEKLEKGASFAQMVEDEQSHDEAVDKGGRTPNVKEGSMRNEKLANYAFSLPANTVGGVPQVVTGTDQTGLSVVIVKVGQKKEARTIPFAEAQKQIAQELEQQQRQKLYQEYIVGLYKSAAIERVDRMADVAMDVAVARYMK